MTDSNGGTTPAVIAASAGLLLKALWFSPWLSLGTLLDAGVLTAALASRPGSVHRPDRQTLTRKGGSALAMGRSAPVDRTRGSAR
ncbi:hypothetical protein [Streptomyces sp. NPDC048825]|uniref:hypothetical protein n=1 Tax=Streptomyces sp. NPDC048825 TaxID=3365592 RepID=UPI0037133D7C